MRDISASFPELYEYEQGLPRMVAGTKIIFIDAIPSQFKRLQAILQEFPADVILYEMVFLGVLPLLLNKQAPRPAMAYCGITTLMLPRADEAPYGLGLPLATTPAELEQYRAITQSIDAVMTHPLREHTDKILNQLGLEKLPAPIFETMAITADLIVQPCVASFEFPLRNPEEKLHFIGALLPSGEGDVPPELAQAKRDGRKIVLVSQGTIANGNLGQLLAPTIQALSGRDDLLVLATTGGKPIDSVPCEIGPNTVVSKFLNFSVILPHVDVLVAFGGYGTVTQALNFGVPMVLSGLGEEKPEIAARVVWTGSGINLPTDEPTAEQLSDAVNQILSNPSYRNRAAELSLEFASHNPAQELLQLIEGLAINR
jgi:UDP:flavonoid glycosyltransferase YjiC (YdhE family)